MFGDFSDLISITMSDQVSYIGANAFYGCTSLKYINILEKPDEWNQEGPQPLPAALATIDEYAFSGCSELNLNVLPVSLEYVGEWAFEGMSSITDLQLPKEYHDINDYSFAFLPELKSVTMSDATVRIGAGAFGYCPSLVYINIWETPENWDQPGAQTLPTALEVIDEYGFAQDSRLELDILPQNLSYVGEAAFNQMDAITCLQFPEGLTNVSWCIDETNNLKTLVIPSTMEDGDFFNFGSRKLSVYFCGTEPSFDLVITEGDEVLGRVIVPTGCKEAYVNGNGYADYNPETPVLTEVKIDEAEVDCSTVTADFDLAYEEELPLLFAVANRKAVAANAEVTFAVYPVGEDMLVREVEVPVATGEGRFNEQGLLEAEMPESLENGKYRICWTVAADGKEVTTPMAEFAYTGTVGVSEIGSQTSGIILENGSLRFKGMAGREFVVFDMAGKAVAAFAVDSDDFQYVPAVDGGIYMVVSRDAKIVEKVKL